MIKPDPTAPINAMLVQDSSRQVFTIPLSTLLLRITKARNPLESLLQIIKRRQPRQAVSRKKTTKQIMAAPLPIHK